MEVNIMSVMLGTEIALERMRAAGVSGQIINTASMAGMGPGLSEKMLAYTVSKHGVVALTRTMGATTKVGRREIERNISNSMARMWLTSVSVPHGLIQRLSLELRLLPRREKASTRASR